MVKRLCPDCNVQLWKDTRNDSAWACVDFVFSDFDISQGKLKTLWTYVSKLVVSCKALRRVPNGWWHHKLVISDTDAGVGY